MRRLPRSINCLPPVAPARLSQPSAPPCLRFRQSSRQERDDHPAELRGPLNTASTLTENLLLEYTEGVDASNVGWGCVDGSKLRSLIELHTAASDFAQRTKAIARMQASNLLDHLRRAMEQSVTGKPVAGAPGAPGDRALFLIGHDTNLTNIAGMLNLTWIVDGRRDDTPPGGALIFELWHGRSTGRLFGADLLCCANSRADALGLQPYPGQSSATRIGLPAGLQPGRLVLRLAIFCEVQLSRRLIRAL